MIPVRDEEATVAELARQLRDVLPAPHEILFIDDGSADATWRRLLEIHDAGRVRLVKFRARAGKSAALMEGFARARAPVVFTLDGDLQDNPAEIPAFLAKIEDGYDLVSGWKRVRHDPRHKVAASRLFNFVMRHMTGIALHDMNCGFKCYRAEVLEGLRIYGEQHRFIPVFAVHRGYRVGEVEVAHRRREHGRSKYGFSRLARGFIDLGTVMLRTRYRDRPAHAFGLGAAACLAGSVGAAALAMSGLSDLRMTLAGLAGAAALAAGAIALMACGWVAETHLDLAARNGPTEEPPVEETRD